MFTSVSSVAVLVKDAKKSAEWYREKLGFDVSIQGHWVAVKPEGSKVLVHLCEKCEEWGDDQPGGNTGISLASDDQKKAYEELKRRGVDFAVDLKTEWFGTYAIFRDPDGNEFWM
jgi:catechol 2,3-dioxygenase-like lactoylglutathione lyase family enzyme